MAKKRKISQETVNQEDNGVWDHEAETRRLFASRRRLFTLVNVWKVCPRGVCKRGHQCLGDIEICSRTFLPLPEPLRLIVAKTIEAVNAGMSDQDRFRYVGAEVERWYALQVPDDRQG